LCTWPVSTIYSLTPPLPELVPVRHGHPRPPEGPRPRRGAAASQIRRQSTGTRSGDLRSSEAYALPIQGYHMDLSTGACGGAGGPGAQPLVQLTLQTPYGVAATFLPHKGGAVPECEKRRAAWCTNSTSHTCLSPPFLGLFHLPISFQPRRGGGARGRGVRCGVGVRVCVSCGYSRRPSVTVLLLLTTKALSKRNYSHATLRAAAKSLCGDPSLGLSVFFLFTSCSSLQDTA